MEGIKAISFFVSAAVRCQKKVTNKTFQGPLSIISIGCCEILRWDQITAVKAKAVLNLKKKKKTFDEFTKVFFHLLKTILETHGRSLPVEGPPSRKNQKLKYICKK